MGLLLLVPAGARGQQAPDAEPEEPPTADAPREFRIGATGGTFLWEKAENRTAEDHGLAGLTVERDLARWVAVRVEGAYGTSTFLGSGARTQEIDTWLLDLVVSGRVTGVLDPVTPFVSAGLGTAIFDPAGEDLVTRNQNTVQLGGGVDVRPFPRFGFRLEYRRYSVDMENLFEVTDRTGESRTGDRITGSVFWSF